MHEELIGLAPKGSKRAELSSAAATDTRSEINTLQDVV